MDYRLLKIFYSDIDEVQTIELPSFSFELLIKTIKKKYQNIPDLDPHSLLILFDNFRITNQTDLDEALVKTSVQSKYHFDVTVSITKDKCFHAAESGNLHHSHCDRVSMSSEDDSDSFEVVAIHFNDVHCSLCNVEIYDIRYHCLNCESDFILCEACETHSYKSHHISHVFAKVRHPEAYNSLVSFRRICSIYPQGQELELKYEPKSVSLKGNTIPIKKMYVDACNGPSQSPSPLQHGSYIEKTYEQESIAIQTDFRHSCTVTHNVTQTTIEEKYSDGQSNSSFLLDESLMKQLEVLSFDWNLESPKQGNFSVNEVLHQSWLLQYQGAVVWPKKYLCVIPFKQNVMEKINDKNDNILFNSIHCLGKLRLCRTTGQLVCKTHISINVTPQFEDHINTITDQKVVINWHICTKSFPPKPLAPRMSTVIWLHQRKTHGKQMNCLDNLEVNFHSEKVTSRVEKEDNEMNSTPFMNNNDTSIMSTHSSIMSQQILRTNSRNSLANPPDEFSFLPSSTDEVLPIYIQREEANGNDDPNSVKWVFVWSKEHTASNDDSNPSCTANDSCIPSSTSQPDKAASHEPSSPVDVIREHSGNAKELIGHKDQDLNTKPFTSDGSNEELNVNKNKNAALYRLIETQSEAWIPAATYVAPSSECDSSSSNVESFKAESQHSTQQLWTPERNSTNIYQYESLAPMNKLMSMGFYDRALNQRLLIKYNDNLELVVNALLSETQ